VLHRRHPTRIPIAVSRARLVDWRLGVKWFCVSDFPSFGGLLVHKGAADLVGCIRLTRISRRQAGLEEREELFEPEEGVRKSNNNSPRRGIAQRRSALRLVAWAHYTTSRSSVNGIYVFGSQAI